MLPPDGHFGTQPSSLRLDQQHVLRRVVVRAHALHREPLSVREGVLRPVLRGDGDRSLERGGHVTVSPTVPDRAARVLRVHRILRHASPEPIGHGLVLAVVEAT